MKYETNETTSLCRCVACGHCWIPASPVCPRCWRQEIESVAARGEGAVFSFAVYRRAYHPAFEAMVPYVVAVIELAEGPRMVSNVVGVEPDCVRVGMPVRMALVNREGRVLPVFRPAEAPASGQGGGHER